MRKSYGKYPRSYTIISLHVCRLYLQYEWVAVLRRLLFLKGKRGNDRLWSKMKEEEREVRASKPKWTQVKQNRMKRVKVQTRKQSYTSYLYTAEDNTNLTLQVVHTFGLSSLSIILCKGIIHRALQVSVYLNRHKKKKKHTQCMQSCTSLIGLQVCHSRFKMVQIKYILI